MESERTKCTTDLNQIYFMEEVFIMSQNTSNQSGNVQYRRARVWQIILTATSGMVGMSFYFLTGMASYSANVGFGIATLAVGGILTRCV